MLQWVRVYESFQCDVYLKLNPTELLRMKSKYCNVMSTVSRVFAVKLYLCQYVSLCLFNIGLELLQ
jgi:hypothetical protein